MQQTNMATKYCTATSSKWGGPATCRQPSFPLQLHYAGHTSKSQAQILLYCSAPREGQHLLRARGGLFLIHAHQWAESKNGFPTIECVVVRCFIQQRTEYQISLTKSLPASSHCGPGSSPYAITLSKYALASLLDMIAKASTGSTPAPTYAW